MIIKLSLILVSLVVINCSKRHTDIYVYNSQIYNSNVVSEFELSHFKDFATQNILVLSDKNNPKLKVRKKQTETICKENQLECEYIDIDIDIFDASAITAFQEQFRTYQGQKFMLVSESRDLSALFLGTLNLTEHKGDIDSLNIILTGLGLSKKSALRDQFQKTNLLKQ